MLCFQSFLHLAMSGIYTQRFHATTAVVRIRMSNFFQFLKNFLKLVFTSVVHIAPHKLRP